MLVPSETPGALVVTEGRVCIFQVSGEATGLGKGFVADLADEVGWLWLGDKLGRTDESANLGYDRKPGCS